MRAWTAGFSAIQGKTAVCGGPDRVHDQLAGTFVHSGGRLEHRLGRAGEPHALGGSEEARGSSQTLGDSQTSSPCGDRDRITVVGQVIDPRSASSTWPSGSMSARGRPRAPKALRPSGAVRRRRRRERRCSAELPWIMPPSPAAAVKVARQREVARDELRLSAAIRRADGEQAGPSPSTASRSSRRHGFGRPARGDQRISLSDLRRQIHASGLCLRRA